MNKIAIVVGHDRIEQGAFSNLLKQSEFAYNSEIAKLLPFDIYFRPTGGNYYQKMVELSKQINGKGYSLVAELHYNSFNGVANGCEALYFDNSAIGKRYSEIYCKAITKAYGTVNRGSKEIKEKNDRGYWFHKLIDAPTLILEPFFGDNQEAIKFKDVNKHAKVLIEVFC
jgi:N-acetylmuramoyl-L-alanine amidase